jgi:hypothetical protein
MQLIQFLAVVAIGFGVTSMAMPTSNAPMEKRLYRYTKVDDETAVVDKRLYRYTKVEDDYETPPEKDKRLYRYTKVDGDGDTPVEEKGLS